MPPVTIPRTPIHDDDHTGTTGTSLDNAWKQEFYDQIDAALAQCAAVNDGYAKLAAANVFTASQQISAAAPANLAVRVAGSTAFARLSQLIAAGRVDLLENINYNGVDFVADDVTKASGFYNILDGAHHWYTFPAGANPRTSALIHSLYLDPTGILNLLQGQLKFPAAQLPSADPNTLDDYEEGSWTPTIQFGGASVGVTYNERVGWYYKIGSWVWVSYRVILGSKGTSTGSVQMTGLPFAEQSPTFNAGGMCGYYGAFASSVTMMPGVYITGSTVSIYMNGPGSIVLMDNTQFLPGSLIGSFIYRTPT